ncbi:Levodione reductase (plasmid) [Lactiplantibacillus plantarum]|uniref:SDR family NAD(P)-dependent oxidoreductase n=1 Tax=Lactiplantibacillus plantarum TaxID=1590 RepID=UPI002AC8AF03|nr:SDR family oxidoreductase [Lactiplantibacillus plantarum]WPW67021.1 Levodione reductase [Lactiplantibacillus plantarum]
MDLGLKDKVVVITGATGGVGQALAKEFAKEGAKLSLSSTAQAKLDQFVPTLDVATDHLLTSVVDVTKEDQVKKFIKKTIAHYGRLDVLVPNAGSEGKFHLIQDQTYDNFEHTFAVNVFGVMYCMKYAAPQMIKQNAGHIVVIASDGSMVGAPQMSHYCSSKHATLGLVKSVAMELGPHGINVNAVSPGAIDTDMMKRIEKMAFPDLSHEEAYKQYAAAYLDNRYVSPTEVADTALYLASDQASHINGGAIRLDNGMESTSR